MGFNSAPEYRHQIPDDTLKEDVFEVDESGTLPPRNRGFKIEQGPYRETPEVLPPKPELADERPVPPDDPADLIY